MAVEQVLDLFSAGVGTWASACEHRNKLSGSRKGSKFLDQTTNHKASQEEYCNTDCDNRSFSLTDYNTAY